MTAPLTPDSVDATAGKTSLTDLDPSKLVVSLVDTLKPVPAPESLVFGQTTTDHMLISTFDPLTGWSAPHIKPYGPLSLDPMSSCLQYCPNVFEGMKAYFGVDGKPRLFRPHLNMARMARSAERVALPPFDTDALLSLIKSLILVDARWIPRLKGYSLYVRPTIIGTRTALGVAASDHALLYIILSPAGPYFPTGPKPISLLAVDENVRAWPGGTGQYKLGLNYASGFLPQRIAAKKGYDQILWLFGDDKRITEVGAMNVFIVIKRDDGHLDVVTPPLDGTILPGVTRSSCLTLAAAHSEVTPLPHVLHSQRLYTHERAVTMDDLTMWSAEGKLQEVFGVGTAVIVAPIGQIRFKDEDIVLQEYEGGLGPVGRSLWERLVDIQEGKVEWEGWSMLCE